MICVRPGGIAPNTYLGAYCGELYPRLALVREGSRRAGGSSRRAHGSTRFPCFTTPPSSATATTRAGTTRLFIDGAVKGSILTRASTAARPTRRCACACGTARTPSRWRASSACASATRFAGTTAAARTASARCAPRCALRAPGSAACRTCIARARRHVVRAEKRGTVAHFTAACSARAGGGDGRDGRKGTLSQTSRTRSPPAPPPPPPPPTPRLRARRAGGVQGGRAAARRACFSRLPAAGSRYVATAEAAFAAEEREALADVLEARFAAETNASG